MQAQLVAHNLIIPLLTLQAAVRIELGDGHTYEYIDGTVSVQLAPEMKGLFPATGDYFDYYSSQNDSKIKALEDLGAFIENEGPYDGILGFSHGAALAAAYMVREAQHNPTKHLVEPAFKVAIFYSSIGVVDPSHLLEHGTERWLSGSEGPLIQIPTAHIWGKNDDEWSKASNEVAMLCESTKRSVFIHNGGHEIPGSKDRAGLYGTVHAIRRAIDDAFSFQVA
ncbi:hypothetical protein DM02DRAFT_530985 [Periconia macrospinosa]|uniref:Serine hydrolase domain-containing protein n=1 Tax=Periconia macrospinosa TaxID=97972 RepID=A0A2V1DK25_9PLEO|nr:hypothetical protein DM02DRAFT_530985 [Periconia macrospinosa]